MCNITLSTNKIVIMHKMIFCFLCIFFSPHSLHGHSRQTKIHDNSIINPENTNNHGSAFSGISVVCEISGANKPTTDKTIGKTQQNKCGNNDATIPILTALFFIVFPFCCYFADTTVVSRVITKICGVPSRIRICI